MPSHCLEISRQISKKLQFSGEARGGCGQVQFSVVDGRQQEGEKPGDMESDDLGPNLCPDTALLYDLEKVS